MKRIALLTCKEIDPNACNDDQLIIPLLVDAGHEANFEIWNDSSVDWNKYTHLIIRSTWDYTEHIDQFISFLEEREKHLQVLNSTDIVKMNYDKSYLKKIKELGYEIVPTNFSTLSKDSLEESFEKFKVDKLVVKPTVGAGASGLEIYKKEDLSNITESDLTYLIQPFLNSIQTDGEISLIYFSNIFSHAIIKVPKAGDFRSQEEFGSNIQILTPDTETLNYSKNLLKDFAADHLFARVDLLKNEQGLWRLVGEVELIEPALYLSFDKESVQRFYKGIESKLL